MRRREKFILSSILLSLGLLATQYISLDYRLLAVGVFFFITYAVSAWALFEDIEGIEWMTTVPFPALYAVSVSLFYFLLPSNILSRIAILLLFGVGMYGLYLTSNIYSVAKMRTIQLLRAAHAVGLFFVLLIMFFFANTLFSFHYPFWVNGVGSALACFPLAIITLWSIELKKKIERSLWLDAGMVSVLVGFLSMVVSFFPASIWVNSVYVVGALYTCLGILITKLEGKLFKNTVYEYMSMWVIMSIAFFFLLPWK